MGEVTIKDIAEHTGVSYATVSRTLNNISGVSDATRKKILEAAKEMGYRPNIHARYLKTNKTNTLALIVPDISNPFFADIAYAVNEYAFQQGYTTILCSTDWNVDIEAKQLEQLRNQRVDGIIYKPAGREPMDLERMAMPGVLISCTPGVNNTYIEVNNRKGGDMAAAHLMECGYDRFAFIGGTRESESNSERILGFVEGLHQRGKNIRPDEISDGDFTVESGFQQASALMSRVEKPNGIFCGNDLIALGVLQYLMENQYKVPDDFGVIGFDDILLAGLPQIQMTTIAQPRNLMGHRAAEILIRYIESGEVNKEHIILEPELIVRRSTRL